MEKKVLHIASISVTYLSLMCRLHDMDSWVKQLTLLGTRLSA